METMSTLSCTATQGGGWDDLNLEALTADRVNLNIYVKETGRRLCAMNFSQEDSLEAVREKITEKWSKTI